MQMTLNRILGAWAVFAALCVGVGTAGPAEATCSGRCAAWEAVEEYNGTNPDLPATVTEAQKFQSALASWGHSWVTDFGWADDAAWERDFKDSALGGTDSTWVDDVDLLLFAGHGNQSGIFFGVNQSDLTATWDESTLGDRDLEWLILDACNVLQDNATKWTRWGWPVFEGLHYIFSYDTITFDVDTRGEDFVKYAGRYDWRVRDAWIRATVLSENGTRAAYMRADDASSNTYEDHLWGHGSVSSDPDDPTTLYYLSWSTG
jgi:hypothetical protein